MKIEKLEKQSLLGQFYPCSYMEIKIRLDNWRVVLREPRKSRSIEEWDYLEFDFTGHKKEIVYREGWHVPLLVDGL